MHHQCYILIATYLWRAWHIWNVWCSLQFICDKNTNDIFSHFFLYIIRFSNCQIYKVLIKDSIIRVLRKFKNKKGFQCPNTLNFTYNMEFEIRLTDLIPLHIFVSVPYPGPGFPSKCTFYGINIYVLSKCPHKEK